MGRKRKIPIESSTIKYMYFIVVKFQGEDILKFGISNNVIRRMTEYNNSQTVGYLKEVLQVYKCDYPKRIETFTKWKMRKYCKPIFKQEYFPLQYYETSVNIAKQFAEDLGYKMKLTSIEEIKEVKLKPKKVKSKRRK